MEKIFNTQLMGIFNGLMNNESEAIEDAARLLAQAVISDGAIYVWGQGTAHAVVTEATASANQMPGALALTEQVLETTVTDLDRALICVTDQDESEAIPIAKKLGEKGVMVVAISNQPNDSKSTQRLSDVTDIYINTKAHRPIAPLENGKKIGWPTTLATLFTYQLIQLNMVEMLSEQDFH